MRYIYIIVTLLLINIPVFGQDFIFTKKGDQIKTKVLEINLNEIKYKKIDNINGPIYSISKLDVLKIIYENGSIEKINTDSNVSLNKSNKNSKINYSIAFGYGVTGYSNLKNQYYFPSKSPYYQFSDINYHTIVNSAFQMKYKISNCNEILSQINILLSKPSFNLSSFYYQYIGEPKSNLLSINLPICFLHNIEYNKKKIGVYAGPSFSYLAYDIITTDIKKRWESISKIDLGLNIGFELNLNNNYYINFNYILDAINKSIIPPVNPSDPTLTNKFFNTYSDQASIKQHLLGNRNTLLIQLGYKLK